jgi:hypothetical protein
MSSPRAASCSGIGEFVDKLTDPAVGHFCPTTWRVRAGRESAATLGTRKRTIPWAGTNRTPGLGEHRTARRALTSTEPHG